jgi:sortase (surface protein transpeptidase)
MKLLALLLGLVLLAGCSAGPGQVTTAPPGPSGTEGSSPTPAGLARAEPTEIDIPKIGAHSTLIPLGLNPDHTIEVPPVSTPRQAGWYTGGPTPGEVGPVVVLGHVDGNKQEGIFYHLKELAAGDEVSVSRKDGTTVRFVVSKVEQIGKDVFPSDAVYGDTAGPEIRLITCGGSFDRAAHSYRDNIIVYAVRS